MVVRHKPPPKVVKKSARELPKPGVRKIEKSEDAFILTVQRNALSPHKPTPRPVKRTVRNALSTKRRP